MWFFVRISWTVRRVLADNLQLMYRAKKDGTYDLMHSYWRSIAINTHKGAALLGLKHPWDH